MSDNIHIGQLSKIIYIYAGPWNLFRINFTLLLLLLLLLSDLPTRLLKSLILLLNGCIWIHFNIRRGTRSDWLVSYFLILFRDGDGFLVLPFKGLANCNEVVVVTCLFDLHSFSRLLMFDPNNT